MDSDRWRRLKSIIADALEKETPDTRAAAVAELCEGDPNLLAEAESLLVEAEALLREGQDDLEECANNIASTGPQEDACAAGDRLGPYAILRKIGEGGMGTVYLAARADGYFEKQVAIKVLKHGSDGDELVGRFQSERQMLARLDHPNIARLIDAGTTVDGLPYLVMEYVDGTPITQFVKEKQPSITERLALFKKIAGAVDAAHRNSVIHRDLKPTNILVNHEGEPKLLDFGIAKLVDNERTALEVTALGCFTPISASPEQAKGEQVTVASDVYALGGVLYELLTETRPLRFATPTPSRAEVVHAVCEQMATAPSTMAGDREIHRRLRGDLDAIVLKALQKIPGKRYPSVAALMEDIECYLGSRPVQARTGQPAYRARKFLFRNRWISLSVASACIALLSIIGLFYYSSLRRFGGEKGSNVGNLAANGEKPPVPQRSIAVLPFTSLSPDRDNDYFVAGVQDDLLTALAKVGELTVISHTSVAKYGSKAENIAKIRDELNVAYVLEGSAQKSGDNIRLNARLVDTGSKTQVWAEQYDRKLDDWFTVQSELAQAIVSQLRGTLSPGEKVAIETHPTSDNVAYDLYLRARESFFQSNWQNAIHLLEKAVARDPHFAVAYCLLAEVQLYLYRFDRNRTPGTLEQAKVAADTALRIAPDLPQSHLAKAQYYYYALRDYKGAQTELRAARSTNGDEAKFVDLSALTERRLGHWKDAIRDGERAAELDPQNPFVINELMESYMALRRFGDAERLANKAISTSVSQNGYLWGLKSQTLIAMGRIKEAETVLEDSPRDLNRFHRRVMAAIFTRDFGRASELLQNATGMEKQDTNTPFLWGLISRAKGDLEGSRSYFQSARSRIVQEMQKRPDDPDLIGNLSVVDAGLGQNEIALREARQSAELYSLSLDAVDAPFYQTILAMVYAWTGNTQAALSELEKVVKLPGGVSYGELRFNPAWDPIRSNPRFDTIMSDASIPLAIE